MKKYLILTALLGLMTTYAAEACKGGGHGKKGGGMHFFNEMDTNSDNKISLTEHNAFHSGKFAEIDTDKNSEISLEEMNNFKKSMKEKRRSEKKDK